MMITVQYCNYMYKFQVIQVSDLNHFHDLKFNDLPTDRLLEVNKNLKRK